MSLTWGDDSVHTIIGASPKEYHRAGFFDSSSAGTFMQSVKRMVEQRLSRAPLSTQLDFHQSHDNAPLLVSGRDLQQKQVDYVLPSRRRAESLMAIYWDSIHVLYPYLDQAKTQEAYDNVWRGEGSVSDEQSFLCLLNIMFALSCQIIGSPTATDQEDPGHTFYLRAKDMLDLMGTGSVRLVQTFLLFGEYCQSTNEPQQCWVYAGLAIRTAQSLGLHLPQTSERVTDAGTKELLRKVWYGCVLMDRMLAMTYGRPCMIGPRTGTLVSLPAFTNEGVPHNADLGHSSTGAQGLPTTKFYVSRLKLYEILHDVLFNFYSPSTEQSQPIGQVYEKYFGHTQGQPSVLGIDRSILEWEKDLPDYLRIASYSRDDAPKSTIYRQAVVLHQMYANLPSKVQRILLMHSQAIFTFVSCSYGRSFHPSSRPTSTNKSDLVLSTTS